MRVNSFISLKNVQEQQKSTEFSYKEFSSKASYVEEEKEEE